MKAYKNKKERLRIYKELLNFLLTEEAKDETGFCSILEKKFDVFVSYSSYTLYYEADAQKRHLGVLFPELWETMTKEFRERPRVYWFVPFIHEERIQLLKRVIDKMTTKPKKI